MLVRINVCCNAPCILTSVIVCINQADSKEKSQQVRAMSRVYALAHSVRIWLGPATDEEMNAMVPLFGSRIDGMNQVIDERPHENSADNTFSVFALREHFFSRLWFTRRWVLQEVVLARAITVYCGHHKASWDHFRRGILNGLWPHNEQGIYQSSKVAVHAFDVIYNLDMERILALKYTAMDLDNEKTAIVTILNALAKYHTAMCSDERDRLYALYGLSLRPTLTGEQETKLMWEWPVDYNDHFSRVYTDFATVAVEAGHLCSILGQAIEFGRLSQQQEGWPSWVPSWNSTMNLRNAEHGLTLYTKRLTSLLDIYSPPHFWSADYIELEIEDKAKCLQVYAFRALKLQGSNHRICHTQPSTCHLDVIASLGTMLDHQCVSQDSEASRYRVAWLLMLALSCVAPTFLQPILDRNIYLSPESRLRDFGCSAPDMALWIVINSVLGLPLEKYADDQYDFDHDGFLSEARRVLQGVHPFCYEHEGSQTFGIAFAEVKPGDFVLRTAAALSARTGQDFLATPVYGLILRPYHPESSVGPATFRLVIMCIDYFPDVEDPEIVDIILV